MSNGTQTFSNGVSAHIEMTTFVKTLPVLENVYRGNFSWHFYSERKGQLITGIRVVDWAQSLSQTI